MGMFTRYRTPSDIGYVAMSGDGDLYIGVTTDVKRRSADHKRYGMSIISTEHIEGEYSAWERNTTRFYDMQSKEEPFEVLNRTNRIRENRRS